MMSERSLRDAIAAWANDPPNPDTIPLDTCFSIGECRRVLDAAGATYTVDELAKAAIEFRRLPFYGGSYTYDARRILRAMLRLTP